MRGYAFCADCTHALAAWTTAGSRGSALLRTRYQCRYATRANAAGVRCTPVHSIEAHKLDDWEDRRMIANALSTLMSLSAKIQGSASDKQKLFERICRLDPARALNAG